MERAGHPGRHLRSSRPRIVGRDREDAFRASRNTSRTQQSLLAELATDDAWKALAPPMLFGHSLGGLISIHTALRTPDRIGGLALSSPYLALVQEVPPVKLVVGKLLSRLVPAISLAGNLTGNDCTHDTAIGSAYDRDPMNFKKANVRWFTETIESSRAGSRTGLQAQRSSFLPASRRRQGDPSRRHRAFHGAGEQRGPTVLAVARPLPRDPERARSNHLDRQVRGRLPRLATASGRRENGGRKRGQARRSEKANRRDRRADPGHAREARRGRRASRGGQTRGGRVFVLRSRARARGARSTRRQRAQDAFRAGPFARCSERS